MSKNAMSDSLTDVVLDTGKKVVRKHKGKAISGSTLAAGIAVLAWLQINPLDFIVENSSAYKQQMEIYDSEMKQLQAENWILKSVIKDIEEDMGHLDHYVVSQNFIARKLRNAEIITMDDYDKIYHAVEHERDSL